MMSTQKGSSNRSKQRHVSLIHSIWYQICRTSLWFAFKICFRVHYKGSRHLPGKGPVLVVANHQSFLDPPAIGCGVFRRMNFLARKTLFKFKPFGWLIDSVDAIPLDQEGIGFAGIKETLRRLKNDEAVLIFPEGSRCFDGQIAPFTSGYVTLAVRSQATIVPVAIAGAFEVFPRTRMFPSFFKRGIRIEYGKPLAYNDYADMSEEEIHQSVLHSIQEMFNRLNSH